MQMHRNLSNSFTLLILLFFLLSTKSVFGKKPSWEVIFGITLGVELEIDMQSSNINEIAGAVNEMVSAADTKTDAVHQPNQIKDVFNAPILARLPKGLSPKFTLGFEITLVKQLDLLTPSPNISAVAEEFKELVREAAAAVVAGQQEIKLNEAL
ncbi:uncharacterized protein LOC130805017 [Amaranthus tricolor]|uniref:uncharacterized protein LOC130805017 n=1 Tax=Amaranthus tricolor TaxID=29722 RepID=UPI00258577CF|nr:uncharacterized protein LOC130805017 [Amaranthus tricolor]